TPGRPPGLSARQKDQLVRLLVRGPLRAGYSTDLLDAAASGQADRPGVRRSLPSWPRLEGTDGVGLELPEARAPRGRARRGRHRPVDADRMAADKKGSWARGPTLHHENGLSSQRVARSETSPRFGTASPVKKLTGSFRYPALVPSSLPSKNRDSDAPAGGRRA